MSDVPIVSNGAMSPTIIAISCLGVDTMIQCVRQLLHNTMVYGTSWVVL
jgi:hypothetical protein